MSESPPNLHTWLWSHGLRLESALTKFGRRDHVASYHETLATPILPDPEGLAVNPGVEGAMAVLKEMVDRSNVRSAARKILEAGVIGYIGRGLLEGYGFQPPRHVHDNPVLVPADVWAGKIDWQASTLRHEGQEFVEVRLITSRWKHELTDRWHVRFAPAPVAKRRGPEGTARQIAEAYGALKEAGQIDFGCPMRHCFPPVRRWLKAHYPEAGFSDARPHDETLRKTIASLFKEDRAKRPQ